MKRRQLIKHLTSNGCQLLREGAKHSIYFEPASGKTSSVPRHAEIADILARKICRDLGIPEL
ncbi:MAG TPA: type II toxin-antitoxin system HicA family toxin [Chloroflexia bacterium]|nr:type II toxin-antitoxin system HicA family toxin [Chloroflexia bacterium]